MEKTMRVILFAVLCLDLIEGPQPMTKLICSGL